MDFSIVKLFPDNLVKALCDTLIHSLWQGLVLAAVTGLIIIFTRKSTPAKRYNLLITALLLFAAATISTFIIALNHAPVSHTSPVAYNQGLVLNVQPVIHYNTPAAHPVTFTDNALSYFNKNAATIVLVWFMIVCARCLQLATGLQGIYYLRRKNIFKVDALWEIRLQELSQNLGLRRVVSMVESGVAQIPMVVGHLKPLILIPLGLLTAMPTEEIEAILIHELAHIRRSDYLVNMLQSLLEIVFFFNPAVLWISALIKTERENCCDDIAVAQSSSKVNYIKALVSCQEYNNAVPVPAYAMALKGNKSHLKDRVTRIISNNNHSLNRVEKSLLAICLVTAGLFTAAFTNAEKINKLVTNAAKAVTHAALAPKKAIVPEKKDLKPVNPKADTTTKGKLRIFSSAEIGDHTSFQIPNYSYTTKLYKEKGTLYQLNYKNKALVSMQVNGRTIPSDQIASYQPIIDQIPHKVNTDNTSDNTTVAETTEKTDGDGSIYYKGNKDTKKDLGHLDTAAAKLNGLNAKLGGSLAKLSAQNQKLNVPIDLSIADSVNQAYLRATANAVLSRPTAPNAPKSPYSNPAYPSKPYPPYNNSGYSTKAYRLKNDERRDGAINDMIKDGIISTRDNLSFKLSSSELIVNGKKQPDDVYLKYRAKYVKIVGNGEWSWLYNYDTDAKRETNSVTDKQKN